MYSKRFSSTMYRILMQCQRDMQNTHCDVLHPAHFLMAFIQDNNNIPARIIGQHTGDVVTFMDRVRQSVLQPLSFRPASTDTSLMDIVLSEKSSRIVKLSALEAKQLHSEEIEPEHLLLAILREKDNSAARFLNEIDIDYQKAYNQVAPHQNETRDGFGFADDDEDYDDEEGGTASMSGSFTGSAGRKDSSAPKGASKTPILENFGTDLTKAAQEGLLDPVVGRTREIERVAQILSRRKKNNPILIGEPGVGKSAIVEGLALRIVEHKIAHSLWDKRVFILDLGSVVAGTKYRGQFEERIRAIVKELQKNPDIIIFIDEIHTIIGAGGAAGTMDAANMLKPALARGEVQCIGATTLEEYRKSIEKDGALERRFQKVLVEATSADDTLEILRNLRGRYEEHHHVEYTDAALQACVRYTERYVTDRSFPDKAIDVMDEVGARSHITDVQIPPQVLEQERLVNELEIKKNESIKSQNFELAADYRDQLLDAEEVLSRLRQEWEQSLTDNKQIIDETHVADVVSMMTGIPVQRIGQEENQRLRQLGPILCRTVIGQDDAIQHVVRAIQRSRVGLKDPNKPIGTFMFVGPTGVGKTYLCKKLAEEMFGSADSIIRVDMSEYGEKHTVSRMVGAPPGYVGYDEGGQLTEKVRRHPYSIVLLDEIEKAHPDVFNILLQVMDEGRLTDGNGATINFKNTIIIMTSNCGTKQVKDFGHGVGFNTGTADATNRELTRTLVKKSLTKQFSPEFLNRLDDVIYFDQLDQDAIHRIVDIELRPLVRRIEDMGYKLEVDASARTLLGQKGYDVQYGARPLKRAIQSLLEDTICELLMSDEAPLPGDTIQATADGDAIKLNVNKQN